MHDNAGRTEGRRSEDRNQGGALETQGGALETQGVAVGLVCRGLSGREPECMANGFDLRWIYTGVRMLENSSRSANQCHILQSETR
jgi:hypothetical protein